MTTVTVMVRWREQRRLPGGHPQALWRGREAASDHWVPIAFIWIACAQAAPHSGASRSRSRSRCAHAGV